MRLVMLVVCVLCREYYDDPAHASELQGVDKEKYVAGASACCACAHTACMLCVILVRGEVICWGVVVLVLVVSACWG